MYNEQMRQRLRARLWWTALYVLRGKTRRARAILEGFLSKYFQKILESGFVDVAHFSQSRHFLRHIVLSHLY